MAFFKSNSNRQRKTWVNSFIFSRKTINPNPLYRLLIADGFTKKNQTRLTKKITTELYLSGIILYTEYKKLHKSNYIDELEKYKKVRKVYIEENILHILLKNGFQYTFNFNNKLFNQVGSSSFVLLDLKEIFYKDLFKKFDSFTRTENLMFFIFYTVHEGFYCSTPPNTSCNLETTTAHCGTFPIYLWNILRDLGVQTEFIGIDEKEKKHILIQSTLKDKNYILDPLDGFVYMYGIKYFICNNIAPVPIVLTQQRSLNYLSLKNLFSKDLNLWIAKSIKSTINLQFNII